ncbi:hypothetical protein [Alishewanella longhuensis]
MKKKATPFEMAETKNLHHQFSNKLLICLHHLYQRGSAGMNTIEANAAYSDSCLHTTIYQLGQIFNIRPERRFERLTNQRGPNHPLYALPLD